MLPAGKSRSPEPMVSAMPELAFGRFFLPGPTEVRADVLAAQTRPMIGHRVPEMEALMGRIQTGLRDVFRTQRPVYVLACSGTGMMEAAIRNGTRARVLALTNGAFSERFRDIAVANGMATDSLALEWGEAHSPDQLRAALRRADYDAVTVCHSETSTGVLNPVAELAAVAHEAGDVALLVDSVSGLGGAPVLTDEWGLDFVLTGSQKCLALPPGLAFGVAQEGLLRRAEAKRDRGLYFDFLELERNIQGNQTPNTPAVSLLNALDAELERIAAEGMEQRWQRHAAMADTLYTWVDAMRSDGVDVAILAPEAHRSPTVTCLRPPRGLTGPQVVAAMKARGFALATGYGKLRQDTFRIGHMGEHSVAELETLLDALADVLQG
jgi:predicted phosphoserine aminotransferase